MSGSSLGSKVKILAEPGFIGNLKNVTVPEGRDVVLTCVVKNLEGHKVRKSCFFVGLWTRLSKQNCDPIIISSILPAHTSHCFKFNIQSFV